MTRATTVTRIHKMLLPMKDKTFSIGGKTGLPLSGQLCKALQIHGVTQKTEPGKYRLIGTPEPILIRKALETSHESVNAGRGKKRPPQAPGKKRTYTKRDPKWFREKSGARSIVEIAANIARLQKELEREKKNLGKLLG